MSRITCHMSHVTFIIIYFFLQSGEAIRWRVCNEEGRPHLVYIVTKNFRHACLVLLLELQTNKFIKFFRTVNITKISSYFERCECSVFVTRWSQWYLRYIVIQNIHFWYQHPRIPHHCPCSDCTKGGCSGESQTGDGQNTPNTWNGECNMG